jgi:hypothetical protein
MKMIQRRKMGPRGIGKETRRGNGKAMMRKGNGNCWAKGRLKGKWGREGRAGPTQKPVPGHNFCYGCWLEGG